MVLYIFHFPSLMFTKHEIPFKNDLKIYPLTYKHVHKHTRKRTNRNHQVSLQTKLFRLENI